MGYGEEETEEQENSTSQGLIKGVKDFIRRQGPGTNQVQELTPDDRDEVIRILRKSSDFRRDDEIDRLAHLFRHIDFPAVIRVPGIDLQEELNQLYKSMFYRKVGIGSYVYMMDDPCDTVWILLQGEVDVDDASGSREEKPGGLFGEDAGQGAAFDQKRTGMALTTEEVHLAGLDAGVIDRVYNQQVQRAGKLMKDRFAKEATGHLRGFFSGWEFLKDENAIRVYKKDHPSSNSKFFKGIGVIEKPHQEVADYLLNFDNRVDWDPLYMKGTVIEQVDKWNVLRHEAYYTPSPLHYNRDFVSLYMAHSDQHLGEHYGICTAIQTTKVPPLADFVRADFSDTGFQIKADPSDPEKSTQVTFIMQVDPKGNYPGWLTDKVNEEQATYIDNIRRAMTRMLTAPKVKIVLLDAGMIFTVKTSHSNQMLDLWCFNHKNLNEVMSMYRTRRSCKKIVPEVGDHLYSNLGNRMIHVVEDSYADQNEYLNKSYSFRSYTESDAEQLHQPCSDILHEQLMQYGLSPPCIPLPWPLFGDVKNSGMEYKSLPSMAPVGQVLKLKALMDVVIVVGSCSCCEDEGLAHESNIDVSSALKYWPKFKFGACEH